MGAAALLAAVAIWTLRPLARCEWTRLPIVAARAADAASEDFAPIERAVFEKDLWWTLTKSGSGEQLADEKKPAALPLEVDLIGVTELEGALVAALYDRRADRLLLVRAGDAIAGATVSALTRERVTLARGDGELVLTRRRPGP